MAEPVYMRLFEAKRAGDDALFYVAIPDDVERPFDRSAALVEAALAKRFGRKFGIRQLRELGDVTIGDGSGGPA